MDELNIFDKKMTDAREVWNEGFETEFLAIQAKSYKWDWKDWERSASRSAAFIVRAPFLYLQLALGSFVTGFPVYLWSNWRRNLDSLNNAGQNNAWNKNEARNIFIVLMLIFGPFFFYKQCALSKEFATQPLRGWRDYERKFSKFALLVQEYRPRNNGYATILRDGDFAAPVMDANNIEMGAAAIEHPSLAPSTDSYQTTDLTRTVYQPDLVVLSIVLFRLSKQMVAPKQLC